MNQEGTGVKKLTIGAERDAGVFAERQADLPHERRRHRGQQVTTSTGWNIEPAWSPDAWLRRHRAWGLSWGSFARVSGLRRGTDSEPLASRGRQRRARAREAACRKT